MATTNTETFFRSISWDDAVEQCSGYQESDLVEKLISSLKSNPPWKTKEKKNNFLNSRDLEMLCALQYSCLSTNYKKLANTSIRVADVGGGNGYMAITARDFFPIIDFEWNVFESSEIASGYAQFENESNIKWLNSSDVVDSKFDVGIFSCILQYLPTPFETLKRFSSACSYLIIMRIPLLESSVDVITTQTFPDKDGIYHDANASWPAWFFSRKKFFSEIKKLGSIVYQWKTPTETILFEGDNIMLEGVLLSVNS